MTTKKKQIDWKIVCTGLLCLTGLEAAALYNGINGTIFTIVIAIIAGAIGVTIDNPFKSKK